MRRKLFIPDPSKAAARREEKEKLPCKGQCGRARRHGSAWCGKCREHLT